MEAIRPTIIDLLNESVAKYASNPFLWEKHNKTFKSITYAETKRQVHVLATGLIRLGVRPRDQVALLSEGRNAWIIGELAILHAGAINVPLSIKLEESNDLLFRLQHSEASFVMVSGNQLQKVRKVVPELPMLKQIVVFDEQPVYQSQEICLENVIAEGEKILKDDATIVERTEAAVGPDDLANISYTSGTTADPKGIMLTHRNYTANVEQALTLMYIPRPFLFCRSTIVLPM